MINGINIYSVVMTVLMVVFGFLCSYIRTKTNLINKAGDFINKAEEDYKDYSKAGMIKHEAVVEWLYSLVPAPMKIFITRQMIGEITQTAFDQMADFATKQLDKIVDKI